VHVGVSYKRTPIQGPYDVIVVGSGMGGLTVAATLARHAKKRVLVLERHYTAGGYTHSFKRPGYEWDVGVHYIGEVGKGQTLRPAYDFLSSGELEWAPLPEAYDRVYLGEKSYDFIAGTRRFAEVMKGNFPGEERAIDRYVATARACAMAGTPYYLDRALPGAVSRLLGPALRAPLLRYARRTVGDVLGEITGNRELRAVLATQWGDYGLSPGQGSFAVHAAVWNHYVRGAYFPVGGAGAIARTIAPAIERAGGAIFIDAEVASVLVEGGRAVGVRMADGRQVRAPVVVSDAGAANTYRRLLPPEHVPASIRDGLTRVGASVGYVCLYLGFKHTDRELGLDGTNLWIYRGADHDGSYGSFLADPEAPLPLVYVSFPSAKDPSFAERYPGRATVDVIVPTRYDWFAQWEGTCWKKRGADYEALKDRFTQRILDVLFTKLPQLRDKIDVAELSTPLSTRHFSGHVRGELYGLDHTPARYDFPLRAETPVKGLYLTGQDLVTCGVSGALFGGLITAAAIAGPGAFVAAMRGHR
jgi:all-trans-retinol 13,14-reductase